MKKQSALLALGLLMSLGVMADAHPLSQFTYSGGEFIQVPIDKETWIQIDDASQRCQRMHGEFSGDPDPNGRYIYDSQNEIHYYLAATGVFYSRTEGHDWVQLGIGTNVATTSWARSANVAGADVQQFLAWQGPRHTFINDPRAGTTPGGRGLESLWYQVGPGERCHVFTEAKRTYGRPDLQTVTLSSGVEGLAAWVVTTGRARLGGIEEIGNWLTK